jgi:hypothetical protein
MNAEKLLKKGEEAQGDDGALLLVNDKQEAFQVNEVILMIWNMCDGISFSDLVSKIAAGIQQDAKSVGDSLEPLFKELERNSLLEIKV